MSTRPMTRMAVACLALAMATLLGAARAGAQTAPAQGASPQPAPAADHSHHGSSGKAPAIDETPAPLSAPADARDPHAYSHGHRRGVGEHVVVTQPLELMGDTHPVTLVRLERLEWLSSPAGGSGSFEGQLRHGDAFSGWMFKAEGETERRRLHEARTEWLYSRAIAPFWNAEAGLRLDKGSVTNRQWVAAGVHGLAPYWFEVEATAYLGNQGRAALRLASSYDLLLTQRLIVQPRLDADLHSRADAANGIGSGLSSTRAALRLRYEINRQFAPYVGFEQLRLRGQTGGYAAALGEPTRHSRWLIGLRVWY